MKSKGLFIAAVLCILAIGCVPSLHPLYTEKDIVFEPGILGSWLEEGGTSAYEFTSDDSTSYTLTYTEDSTSSYFTATLVKLGDHMFLDFLPDEPDCGNEFYKSYLIPAHSFYKVTLSNDILRMDGLDVEWMKKQLQDSTNTIAFEWLDEENYLLTASTEALQNFVLKHADDKNAFPIGDNLYRQ